ncbi:IS1/IS1595 family N-terminal zinc-binding domain-containing protein [Kamptonema formosum]|uniref:IS1/IS1595 family N-terminal zinc-binding domain-containing protein n=1 Tax=Kamptonema formosum TaxID=331992 RepID=UPI00034CFF2E|nr:NYN domain-containing protein [Oscillatoria sp. PCC 10802]
MKCPQCQSPELRKNGRPKGQQRYQCKACGKQFLAPTAEPTLSEALPTALGDAVQFESNGHAEAAPALSAPEASAPSAPGIAILLLDAENLKLDIKPEQFLASLCACPLQVKIAFANWRNPSFSKLDAELHERGYQMVHVPEGKNSADAKMIAVGSSIFFHYPNVKEVFVCSSDGLLNHLCTQLQNMGLTVYRARTKNKTLTVENLYSGELKHYSLRVEAEIPSFEGFVKQVEELIQAEHNSLTQRTAQFSAISALLQERRNLTLSASRSNDSPAPVPEATSLAPAPEEEPAPPAHKSADVELNVSAPAPPLPTRSIQSKEELERALLEIIEFLQLNNPLDKVSVGTLSSEVHKLCGETANSIVKRLKLGGNLTKFLKSCTAISLVQNSTHYTVSVPTSPSSEISTREEL